MQKWSKKLSCYESEISRAPVEKVGAELRAMMLG